MKSFYTISKNVMLNEVENQGVLFCQSEVGEKIYYLNDTSVAVILFLQTGKKTFSEITNEIFRLFDVDENECKSDIEKLLIDLNNYQIIDITTE